MRELEERLGGGVGDGGPIAGVRSGAKTVVQAVPLASSRQSSAHRAIGRIVFVLQNRAIMASATQTPRANSKAYRRCA